MESHISYSEPTRPSGEREIAASAEEWRNWAADQIRNAIEAEREQTFDLLTECSCA
jgi:hypothetical protein